MTKRFDEILSECIRRLEAGAEVEAVLSKQPEHADELRPHLEVWASLSAVEKAQATDRGRIRGRQRMLSELAGSNRDVGFVRGLASRGGLSMKFLAVFVTGAALAIGVTFLTGNLDFGGDGSSSSAEAQVLPDCLTTLDLNADGQLTVEDVLLFKGAIESQDLAFDFNADTVVDIHDAVTLVQQVVECFGNIQVPPPQP